LTAANIGVSAWPFPSLSLNEKSEAMPCLAANF